MRVRAASLGLALLLAAPGLLTPLPAHADAIRDRQWMIEKLGLRKAWQLTRGKRVIVAVLDTGVDPDHLDLAGKVTTGPDYTGGSTPVGSEFWALHGTAMAGIIAAHGHGTGGREGVKGVAPGAQLLSIRVTWENKDPAREVEKNREANKDAMAKAIRYAVDHGADVINMSLGGGKADYTGNDKEQAAVDYALSKGVVLVASMGNDGAGQNRRNFPAAYQGVIAVGAVDRSFRPWKDSNHHSWVSVAAPGVGIVTTQPRDAYATDDGTSASAAIVAGIAALLRSRFPDLTPEQIRDALENGTTHHPASGRDDRIGTGIVNATKAVQAAEKIAKATGSRIIEPGKKAPAVDEIPQVATAPQATAAASETGTSGFSTFVIAVLACGGVFITAGVTLAYRTRRQAT